METLIRDLRHAVRRLIKSPAFTLLALLTLALGIGANTAIYSVVNAVLWRPLPMEDADRVVRVLSLKRRGPGPSSGPDFLDMRAQSKSFTGLAGIDLTEVNFNDGNEPERLRATAATANAFEVAGIRPLLGRGFQEGEDQPGQGKIVVLGHSLWTRRFGADPGVLGRAVTVNGEPFTVVGVLPANASFPRESQLWIPLIFEGSLFGPDNRGAHWLEVFGRLKPGVTLEQANADLTVIARQLEEAYPKSNTGKGARVISLREELTGDLRPALLMILGAVALVLLIACANVSSLVLARAIGSEGEISVRLALGANRWQIVRQLLIESTVLAIAGAAVGLLAAGWSVDLLARFGPRELMVADLSLDGSVLAFTGALTLGTAMVFGLVPALQVTRVDLNRSLRDVGRTTAGAKTRLRALLVVGETALAVTLLILAGLLLKSFVRLQSVDPGFRSDHVLVMELALPENQFKFGAPEVEQFYTRLLERMRGLPGVEAAGASFGLPLTNSNMISSMHDLSLPPEAAGSEWLTQVRVVTAGYFEALRIPLKKGRLLSEEDSAGGARGVLINEEAARRYWPGQDPVGRTVEVGIDFGNGEFGGRIVGIVGNVLHGGLSKEPFAEVYVPFTQARGNEMSIALRTSMDPMQLAPSVRREIRSLNKDLPVAMMRTLDQIRGEAVAQPRFFMYLVAIFAVLALVLAAIGIYGVVNAAVSYRTRELGIRMALGADGVRLVRFVVGQYLKLTAVGVVLGLGIAVGAGRAVESLLFGVRAVDWQTLSIVTILLSTVGLVASFLPAWKATRIHPVVALKHE
jgi:putative ABC transport system permease protein